jgi:outer membrane protein TolC
LQTAYDNALRKPAGAGDKEEMKKGEASEQIESLLKERRDTLRRVVDVLTQQYENGSAAFESIMLASERLFDAELELAATKAERIAIYEKRVSALRAMEKFAEGRFKAGFRTTEVELLDARAARLQAQIRLLREKEGGK